MGTIQISESKRIRYRVIVKELCQECFEKKRSEKAQVQNCNICKFLRYNNVTDLLKFQSFLDIEHSTWDWWKVYKYIKGKDDTAVLATFKNLHKKYIKNSAGNWIFVGTERDVPTNKTLG